MKRRHFRGSKRGGGKTLVSPNLSKMKSRGEGRGLAKIPVQNRKGKRGVPEKNGSGSSTSKVFSSKSREKKTARVEEGRG